VKAPSKRHSGSPRGGILIHEYFITETQKISGIIKKVAPMRQYSGSPSGAAFW
jgi:hypothetical protein